MKRAAFLLAFALALGAGSAQAKPAKRAGARPAPHKTTAPARGAPQTGPQNGPRERAPSPSPPAERRSDDSGETATADASDSAAAAPSAGAPTGATRMKTKTYTFGAMDVEGKLKTPQLLYFLNRVKLELDMSAPDKRSFMKELQQSADDKSL